MYSYQIFSLKIKMRVLSYAPISKRQIALSFTADSRIVGLQYETYCMSLF